MTDTNPFDAVVGDGQAPSDNPFDAVVGGSDTAPAAVNPFEDAIRQDDERRSRQQFLEVMRNSKDTDPARQAKAIEVSKLRGVPVGVAYQYLEDLTPQDRVNYDSMVHRAPATARLLADPAKGPVAFPDAKPLGDIEENLKAFSIKNGLDKPVVTQPLIDQMFGTGASLLTPEQQAAEQTKRIAEAKAAADALPEEQAALEAERKRQAEAFRQSGGQDLRTPFGGNAMVASPEQMAQRDWQETQRANDEIMSAQVNPPTQKATAAYLNTVLRTLANFPTMAAQGVSALADSLDSVAPVGSPQLNKQGRSPTTEYLASFPDYWAQLFPPDAGRSADVSMRATEAVTSGVPFIAGGMAAKAIGSSPAWFAAMLGGLQQAGQGEADAAANGADVTTKNIATWLNFALGTSEAIPVEALFATAAAGGKGLARFLQDVATNAGIEAGQNVAQQVPADLFASYTYDPKRDVMGNALEALKMGAIAGGFFGGVTSLIGSMAERNHQTVLALGDAVKKLKLADFAPQILDEHIANLKKQGAAPEHVTAPADAVETLFQEMEPEMAGQFPKTAQSLAEARATGVEVTIPTEELIRLGKLTGYKTFAADVSVNGEMSLNDHQKLRSDVEDYIKNAETSATPQEDSPIFKDIREQSMKAGNSPEVATAHARLWDAFFQTQSERTGVPAADLARRYGVKITNSAITAQQMGPQLDALRAEASDQGAGPKMEVTATTSRGVTSTVRSYEISNPLGGDKPETVKVITRSNGDAIIQREGKDDPLIDIGNMLKAGFSPEKAVAMSLGDHPDGTEPDVSKVKQVPVDGKAAPAGKQDPALAGLRDQLAVAGITPAALKGMTNEQVARALAERTLNQSDPVQDEPNAPVEPIEPDVTPDVAPAVEVANLDAANTLSKSKTWEKGRDLKIAIQNAVLGVLQKLGLDPIVRSSSSLHYLTTVGLKDALAALEQNPNAIGWYDVKTRQALAVMALVHPEILKDANARFAFTWALAVTSNDIKVGKNFELADEVYTRFKADGRMPSDIKAGNAQSAINDSLQLFNDLRDRWGMDNLRKFMLTDFTVKEITGIDPELKPTGEAIDEVVRGAAVLGPKIGNGFFSNLYGNFDALTMDRWLVRTWGRWTGTLIELDLPNIENSRTRLTEAVKGLDKEALAVALRAVKKTTKTKGETEVKPGDREALIKALDGDDLEALAFAVNKASMEPKFRSAMNASPGGEELRLAGNSLAKYLDGQKEQPGGKRITGPNERRYIREVFNNILATLKQDPRFADLKMADLQAVPWYAEKRLYETAKEDTVVQDGDVAGGDVSGYEDEEAPDYANAAANRARQAGVSDRKINAALKREADNGRPTAARPGDAGPGGETVSAVAGGEGGQQVPARGFARDEKRSFIQREALDRVRSNRGSNAEQSWSYTRGSGADGARPRVLKALGVSYVAEWKAGGDLATIFRANGISTPAILELEQGSAKNAAQFVSAISTARDTLGPIGEAVKVYSPEEYAGMRLFVTKDGQSGFALKPDGDIVSVFSAKGAGNGRAIMETAIAAGGKKLDCFATILPEFYATHGFRATSRLLWNDEIAMADMPNWDKVAMAKFNNGEPDVVFMVYDPAFYGEYDRKGTPLKSGDSGYDLAVRAQERAMRAVQAATTTQTTEGPSPGPSSSQGTTTLNQGGPEILGSIQFGPARDRFLITLTQKANLSTFIHESSHFFLEVLQDLVARGEASAQQVADLKTLKRWMAVEDGKQIDVPGHEKFARSWEQFVMEGKAPSLALHGIFQKFKAWMIFVYKRLANVRGELNDEIRGVMDRLVASDAAIAEARTMVGWRGNPLTQEQTGLDDAGYQAYTAQWIKANDAQSADADARIMLEAARELKKTWTEEKAKVTREVEAELAQTRGWKAWKLLQNGEGLEAYGRTTIKIDPDTIPKEWRRDTVGMTASPQDGGLPFDMVAEMLDMGFDSGEQMMQAIGGAKLAQKAIPLRVRQVMVERHGEMDAAALSQEAMKAVHNTPTMDVLLTEFRALAAKANLKVGKDTKRILKMAAEERVAQLTQRQLDPSKWRRAEVKAAEEAGKLAAQGKDMDAALAKRKQLMAAAMARASLDAQDRISAIKDYLATFTTNRRRAALGKAGETYLDAVDQILEGIQFKEVSLRAITARKSLAEIIAEADANGEPVFVSDQTRDLLNRKNYSELTLEELEGVHDAVKNLWTIAKDVTTVRKGQEKIALEKALTDITAETDETLPAKKQRDHLNPGRIDKMMGGLSRYHAGNLKIEFILDWLGKTAHSLIFQPIVDAQFESWKLHRDLTAPFMDKLRNMPKEQRKRWDVKRQFLNYPLPLKGENLWMIALNLGNPSNKEKMLSSVADGGFGWTESEVMAQLNQFMTKADWDLVQETWDTIEQLWPRMEAVVKRATGLSPPKVEASEVVTPYGTYRGGYFPVVYDLEIDARMDDIIGSTLNTDDMFAKKFTAFAVNNGFTKGRTTVKGKLLFSPGVIADHLGEVIHYVTHYDAVKQADKIIRAPVFKALVKGRLGDAVYKEMKSWLRDVATNSTQSDRATQAPDRALRWLRNSAQLTSLGFNVLSALKQPLGVVNGLDAVGPVYWAHGVQKAWLSPSAVTNWKYAFANSKELPQLLKTYDRDLAAISKHFSESLGSRLKDGTYMYAFMPLSVMQTIANVATWHGAYLQGTKDMGMSEKDAHAYADKIVRTTQGSGAMKDLAGIQRGDEADKLFTMFYSYFSVVYNRMSDIQVREKGAGNLHRKAMRYTLLLLLPSLLNMMADDAWKDMFHEDKKREKDQTPFLVRLGLETMSAAAAAFPVAREVYSGVEAFATGKRPRSIPAVGIVDTVYRGVSAVVGIAKDDKDLTRSKARAIVAATGIVTGTPIYGVYRLIDDVFGKKMFDE